MSRRNALLFSLFLGILAFGVIFGPALAVLSTQFLGIEYVDHYGTQWFYWYVDRAVATGEGFTHTDLLFYPYGKDILLHTGANVLDALAAIPFRRIFGPVLGYNLFVLAGQALTAVAFFRFAREVTDDDLALGVGTVLFLFTPYVLFEAVEGRPTQSILLLPVLYLHLLWRTGLRPGWRAPVAAGVLLALTGYQYWYYAFFGGVLGLAHGAWRILRPPPDSGTRFRQAIRHLSMAATALALATPVALDLLVKSENSTEVPGLLDTTQWSLFASPPKINAQTFVGLFTWQPLRQAAGFFVQKVTGVEEFLVSISWSPLVLLVLVAIWLWRPSRLDRGPLLSMLLVGVTVCMGPIIVVGSKVLPNAPYVYLVKNIGFLQRLWWPGRMFAFVAILLGLVAVAALAATRTWPAWRRYLASSLVAAAWVGELWMGPMVPYPTWDATVPAGYRCLATGPEGAIIEIPYAWTQAHLYYQTVHGRPMLGGMVEDNPAFTPFEINKLRQTNTFIQRLLELPDLEKPPVEWREEHKEDLHELGYRYVLVQKDAFVTQSGKRSLRDGLRRARQRALRKEMIAVLGRPVYEDQRVAIYAPWEDPSPCEGEGIEPDRKDVGIRDAAILNPGAPDPKANTIERLIKRARPDEEDTGMELDLPAVPPAPGGTDPVSSP